MPFLNLSGDPTQDYFVDGVVEDIIAALSRISWLFVIARNSSFAYKGRAVDEKQHLFAKRFDDASSWAAKSFRDLPTFLIVEAFIAASHALAGRTDEAQRAMQHLRQLDPVLRISNLTDYLPIRRPQDLATFSDGLRKAGLPE